MPAPNTLDTMLASATNIQQSSVQHIQRSIVIAIIVSLVVMTMVVLWSRPSASARVPASTPNKAEAPKPYAYLDNNATTPCFEAVIQKLVDMSKCCFANPSSMHLAGQRSREELERCRKDMRRMVSASRFGVVFTSGATESNNLAIRACVQSHIKAFEQQHDANTGPTPVEPIDALSHIGLVYPNQMMTEQPTDRPSATLPKVAAASPHRLKVVTTPLEHPSVYETLASLDIDVITLPVCKAGRIDLEELEKALQDEDVIMVCIATANSEIGVLQDARAITHACRAHRVYCHLDMTQVFGRYPINLNLLGADSVTLSAHKFHGPKGVGALFYTLARPPPMPCTTGGKQEDGVRGGTENLPSIAGMALALRMCSERIHGGSMDRMRQMRDRIEAGLSASIPGGVKVHGPKEPDQRLYQTLSVVLPYPSADVIKELSDQKVYVGIGGCACSKGKYSKGLDAIGVPAEEMARTIRISLGHLNTEADVDRLLRCMRIASARVARDSQ